MGKKGFALVEAFLAVFIACITLGVFSIAVAGIASACFQKVSVRVDGEEVFHGRAICVNVQSAGASTYVGIGGLPCSLKRKSYVSNDVSVNPL